MKQDGKRFVLRFAPRPAASLTLRAAGFALPPTVPCLDADCTRSRTSNCSEKPSPRGRNPLSLN
jgi:hypothetical protein